MRPTIPKIQKLVELLHSRTPSAREVAALKLWQMGSCAVMPLLESLPQGDVPGAGSPQETIIVSILSKMGARAVPPLISALSSDSAQARELAALVLGEIADQDSLGALHKAAREAAAGSLEHTLIMRAIRAIEGPDEPPSYLSMEEAALEEESAKDVPREREPMYF